MEQELLSRRTENTLMITVEFLEDGYVLKSGRSRIHSYRLDLLVRNDITLDRLLGAVYAGIRQVLVEQYHLDLSQNWASIVYQDLQDPFAMRAADDRRGKRRLRPQILREATLRAAAMRYRGQRRRFRELEQRYPMLPDQTLSMSPEKKERLGWIVCWQVFHECYRAYRQGYPDDGGNAPADRVRTEEYLCHPVIARGGVDLRLDENGTYYGGTNRPQLQLIQARDGGRTLRDLGFVNSSRLIFDPVLWHHSAALYDNRSIDETLGDTLPFYRVGDRMVPDTDTAEYRILQPRDPVPTARMDPIPLLLPPVLTTSAVVGTWALTGDLTRDSLAAILCAMFGTTAGIGLLYHQIHRFHHHRALRRWLKPYHAYIRAALKEIAARQTRDAALLQQLYPPVLAPGRKTDLVHRTLEVSGELFARKPEDRDFLQVRVGVSAAGSKLVPSLFPVTGELKNAELSTVRFKNLRAGDPDAFELVTAMPRPGKDDSPEEAAPLELLPQEIAREFGYLSGAPVLVDLRHAPALGVVFPNSRSSFLPFLSNLVLDLCCHHRPEHLQFVMLCPETADWKERQDLISRFKHLPHFGELLTDLSAFAFNRQEAWKIFNQLRHRLARREDAPQPHIVVLVLEEYDLREHGLASRLPGSPEEAGSDRGISFVFCKHSARALPPFCARVIWAEGEKEWFCLPSPHSQDWAADPAARLSWGEHRFRPDLQLGTEPRPEHKADADRLYRAFKLLSALYHRKEDRTLVPSYLELFALHMEPDTTRCCAAEDLTGKRAYWEMLRQELSQTIRRNWMSPRGAALSFPVGKNESGTVWLDLHEQGAGAHLLITGDPGTGKTTAAANCLLSMCVRYSPWELELIPVDHLGTGLHRLLGALPHVHRQVLPSDGTRAALHARIRELMCWLDEVCLRRRKLLLANRMTHIDQFNAAFPAQLQRHLVLAIDDYGTLAHLLRNAPPGETDYDLDAQLMQLMQTAQGLGIHLVLSAAPMNHASGLELMERMPVRLCMKLSDARMSRLLIDTPAAAQAAMPARGRAFLVGGDGDIYEYLQLPTPEADVGGSAYAPFQITLAAAGGSYRAFFDSRSYLPPDNEEVRAWSEAADKKLPPDWQTASTLSGTGPVYSPTNGPGDDPPHTGDFAPGAGDGDDAPAQGQGDFAPGRDRHRDIPQPEPEPEDFTPGARWESVRAKHQQQAGHGSPWEKEPITGDWRENYYRRWRGHPYQYEPPVREQPLPVREWARPDASLFQPAHFGVTQQEFLGRLLRDMARSLSPDPVSNQMMEV